MEPLDRITKPLSGGDSTTIQQTHRGEAGIDGGGVGGVCSMVESNGSDQRVRVPGVRVQGSGFKGHKVIYQDSWGSRAGV